MTVKRQRLLTLFLTLQKRSTLIWKWEQPTHGKEGQTAKWDAEGAGDKHTHGGCNLWLCNLRIPKAWAHYLLTDFVLILGIGVGGGRWRERQIKDRQSFQDQERDNILSWFKHKGENFAISRLVSVLMKKGLV